MTSPPGGPFLGLTVGSPAHSPRGPDCSSLIHTAPGLTRLHLTALHTAPGQPASAALSRQTWAQTHLLFPTCSPSWMIPCLSKPVSVPTCTPGMMPTGLLGMSSDPGGTRPGKHGSPCLRQAVPPAPVCSSYYRPPVCPSSDANPQSFSYSLCLGVCVCRYLCSLSRGQRNTAPKQGGMVRELQHLRLSNFSWVKSLNRTTETVQLLERKGPCVPVHQSWP